MSKKRPALTPFGRKVKKRLIDRNMTQVELAALVGCDEQYINKILYGKRSGRKYRAKIADILDIPLDAAA